MKKFLLAVTVMALTFSNANAYDFKYLAFEKSDGQVLRFSVEDVVIQQTNGTLVVTAGGVDTPLDVSELAKMYFTNDESASTDVTSVNVTPSEGHVKVYNLAGECVREYGSQGAGQNTLDAGVYIIKSDDRVVKIIKNVKR